MYMDSRFGEKFGKSLTLTSPLIKTSNEQKCLRMALSMFGKDMGSTVINLIKSDGSEIELFKQEGNKNGDGLHWFDVSETLPQNQEFKVLPRGAIIERSRVSVQQIRDFRLKYPFCSVHR